MPERKAKRERATKIVEEASASAPAGLPRSHEVELALKSACLAEAIPREELIRRITVEWLRANGYLPR